MTDGSESTGSNDPTPIGAGAGAVLLFRAALGLIIAANVVGLTALLLSAETLRSVYPDLRSWMVPLLAVLALTSVVACVALWRWRRWGFALLGAAYGVMLAVNLSFSAPPMHTALGPLGLLILGAAWWPVRHRFATRSER